MKTWAVVILGFISCARNCAGCRISRFSPSMCVILLLLYVCAFVQYYTLVSHVEVSSTKGLVTENVAEEVKA